MNRAEMIAAVMQYQEVRDAILPSVLVTLVSFPRVLEDPFTIDGDKVKLLKYWTVADLKTYQAHSTGAAPEAMLLAHLMREAGAETVGDYWDRTV